MWCDTSLVRVPQSRVAGKVTGHARVGGSAVSALPRNFSRHQRWPLSVARYRLGQTFVSYFESERSGR
jgi:hypothetical protein